MGTSFKTELENLVSAPVKWDCPLAGYTSLGIGGPARALVIVEDENELLRLLRFFRENEVPWRVIGRGTNLLVGDGGFSGVVLVLGHGFQSLAVSKRDVAGCVNVTVGCAYGLTRLANRCVEMGLSGLEFASGIPGTVGGAIIMNAGAWGREIADVITVVTIITPSGRKNLNKKELEFGYRCWENKKDISEPLVVSEITLNLSAGDSEAIKRKCEELRNKRREKQPQKVPNAGSFFKNPSHDSAGRLIEGCGLKGKQIGGAMVSPVHANFIVNQGQATAADVLELMTTIQEKVKKSYNIHLEPEVHII